MSNEAIILVTLGGECFEATFQRQATAAWTDGVFYQFKLKDLAKNRGEQPISLFISRPEHVFISDYDKRLETVRWNVLRRAFDSGVLDFDAPFDEHTYKKIPLQASDFQAQSAASGQEVKQFIIHKAYWLGFRRSSNPSIPLRFDSPTDLEYLGVNADEVKRYIWLLEGQGLLDKTLEGMGRPEPKLIDLYESRQSVSLANERVFPKGSQYEAFREITAILRSAKKEIFVADNYLDESLLDMIGALPLRLTVKLLTFAPRPDFKVAVKKFMQQYKQSIEVKVHDKDVHDRAIVIDDAEFYALGASIKDIGEKLSLLNELQDQASIKKLRQELLAVWASATLLS